MTRTDLLIEVIEAVAAADDVAAEEVNPLHDYIEPGILDKLDDMGRNGDWRFTFQFEDHQVTITHDSRVFIDGVLYRSEKSV